MCRFLSILVVFVVTCSASAQEVLTIASWNAEEMFDTERVAARQAQLEEFSEDVQPDVLMLLEVNSVAVATAIRDAMGLAEYHVVCSDFNQNDNNQHASFEVAILSRFPLANVVEFDRSPDNTGQPGEPAEVRLERVPISGIADVGVGRGFLYAEIPVANIALVVTHLKSSRGARTGTADHENAQKRELVAAAIAKHVSEKLEADEDATILVGGDFNVGETDGRKNGHVLTDDKFDSGDGDLYDDTHAILSAGLIDGLKMASLTKSIGEETFNSDDFRGTGPIDCLYVAGARRGDFTLAKKTAETYGSDHFSVYTRFVGP